MANVPFQVYFERRLCHLTNMRQHPENQRGVVVRMMDQDSAFQCGSPFGSCPRRALLMGASPDLEAPFVVLKVGPLQPVRFQKPKMTYRNFGGPFRGLQFCQVGRDLQHHHQDHHRGQCGLQCCKALEPGLGPSPGKLWFQSPLACDIPIPRVTMGQSHVQTKPPCRLVDKGKEEGDNHVSC